MRLLEGKVAIITGASSGIGKVAAKLFAANGAAVVLVARRGGLLDLAVEEIQDQGGRALAIIGDVTEQRTHEEAVAAARATFGGLHIAFNNAGSVGATRPLAEIEPQQWSAVLSSEPDRCISRYSVADSRDAGVWRRRACLHQQLRW